MAAPTKNRARKAPSSARSNANQPEVVNYDAPGKDATIHERLIWVQHRVPNVEKTGTVSFGKTKFDHMQEHGLIEILRPLLRQAGLGWYIDVNNVQRSGNHVQLVGQLVLFDKRGNEIRAGITNEGVDANDKATNKALTGLTKYALQKFFNVPTEAIDDNETVDTPKSEQIPGTKAPPPPADDDDTELLRQAIAAAVKEGHLTNNRVKALLQGTYNVERLDQLSAEDQRAVAQWVVQQVKQASKE